MHFRRPAVSCAAILRPPFFLMLYTNTVLFWNGSVSYAKINVAAYRSHQSVDFVIFFEFCGFWTAYRFLCVHTRSPCFFLWLTIAFTLKNAEKDYLKINSTASSMMRIFPKKTFLGVELAPIRRPSFLGPFRRPRASGSGRQRPGRLPVSWR